MHIYVIHTLCDKLLEASGSSLVRFPTVKVCKGTHRAKNNYTHPSSVSW